MPVEINKRNLNPQKETDDGNNVEQEDKKMDNDTEELEKYGN